MVGQGRNRLDRMLWVCGSLVDDVQNNLGDPQPRLAQILVETHVCRCDAIYL